MPIFRRTSMTSVRRGVDVLVVHLERAGDLHVVDQVVHPVQASQQRRLAASRRTDERGCLPVVDVQRDVEERLLRPVEEVGVLDSDGDRMRFASPLGGGVTNFTSVRTRSPESLSSHACRPFSHWSDHMDLLPRLCGDQKADVWYFRRSLFLTTIAVRFSRRR